MENFLFHGEAFAQFLYFTQWLASHVLGTPWVPHTLGTHQESIIYITSLTHILHFFSWKQKH